MRVDPYGRVIGSHGPAGPRRAAGPSTFRPETFAGEASAPRSGAAPSTGVGGLDALLALQSIDPPPEEAARERRRRAIRRGQAALDGLDGLKLALLGGPVAPDTLAQLRRLADEPREPTGDERLDGLLDEIELRLRVELAKRARRPDR